MLEIVDALLLVESERVSADPTMRRVRNAKR